MLAYDRPCQGEAQSRAARRIAARFLQAHEGLEHFFEPVFRNAGAVILDGCNEEIRIGPKRDASRAAIADRILDQVSHRAADLVGAATARCKTLDLHFDGKVELDKVVADAFD